MRRAVVPLAALAVLAALTLCPGVAVAGALGTDTPEGVFTFTAGQPGGVTVDLRVLFTSDVHGYGFVHGVSLPGPDEQAGGLFSLATLVSRARFAAWREDRAAATRFMRSGKDDGVLLLDAGDQCSGTYDDSLSKGLNTALLMNSPLLDYDATTMGNHSDDHGGPARRAFFSSLRFPVVISNVVDEATSAPLPGTVTSLVKVVGGLRVGLLGVTHMRATKLEGARVTDVVEAFKAHVPRLRAEADVVLVLAHLGLEKDRDLRAALAALDDQDPNMNVDVIIDAHSHANLAFKLDDDSLVVQAGHYGARVGELCVAFDAGRRKVTAVEVVKHSLLTRDVEPSPRMLGQFADLVRTVREQNEAVVLDGLPGLYFTCPDREEPGLENPAGAFVSRATLEVPVDGAPEPPEVGVVYEKCVRDHVAANDRGEVTNDTLHRVIPFDENVVIVPRTGAQLRELAVKGLRSKFTWAGLRVTVLETPGPDGQPQRKLEDLSFFDGALGRFVPVQDDRTYRVACVPFFAKVFMAAPESEWQPSEVTLKELLRRFLEVYRGARDRFFTAADPAAPTLVVHQP